MAVVPIKPPRFKNFPGPLQPSEFVGEGVLNRELEVSLPREVPVSGRSPPPACFFHSASRVVCREVQENFGIGDGKTIPASPLKRSAAGDSKVPFTRMT